MALYKRSPFFYTIVRYYNRVNPRPSYLAPSPPSEESKKINPKAIVKPSHPFSENDVFNEEFINRNPRNLEHMLLAVKPSGYMLDEPTVTYWNKLLFEKSNHHTSAKVIHNSGKTVISTSTKEWAIWKHLYSTTDLSAAENIARILAQRCLESGILFVYHEFTPKEKEASKVQLFLNTLEKEGLKLEEPEAIKLRTYNQL